MAAVHPHQAATRPAQARRSIVPPGPKLRDSCHACAASKVKCDKEKPTCARCVKRGVTCEYFATKRAGRKHDNRANENRPSDTTNATQTLPGSASSTSPEAGVLTSPSLIQQSRRQLMSSYSDIAPDLLSPVDPAWSSMLSNDFNDFSASPLALSASPLALSVHETFESENLAQPYTSSGGVNNSHLDFDINGDFNFMTEDAFSFIDKAVSELPSVSKPLSPPNSRGSTISDAPCFQDLRSESSCSCLIRALGLLKQLFPNASTACARARMQASVNDTCQLPTIQCVLEENQQAIDAVSTMLQCQCSQDEYLLAIMSLIVFKVLGWYAAAARQTPMTDGSRSPAMSISSHHSEQVLQSPAVVGSYCIDGEDQGRMVAQLVLSKLHRVQQLVNVLSQHLKGHRTRNGTITPNSAADGTDTPPDRESTSHFSERMLDQLEADLRKRLRALSLDIVDVLR